MWITASGGMTVESRVFKWGVCLLFLKTLSKIHCDWHGELGELDYYVRHGLRTREQAQAEKIAIEARAQRRLAAAELEFPSRDSEWRQVAKPKPVV